MHNIKWMLIGLALVLTVSAKGAAYDAEESNYTIQALLGGVKYEDLEFQSLEGTNSTSIDMTTMPQLGGAWATKPKGDTFQYGLETSFLLGFRLDEVKYAYAGGNGAYVNISTSMWMFDFAGGVYGNVRVSEAVRFYGGAGPLMMYANYQSKRDYTDLTPNSSESDSVFGFGLYARTGLEFQIQPQGWLGAGVRWNWSNADFSDVGGSTDISGIAAFVTYTVGL